MWHLPCTLQLQNLALFIISFCSSIHTLQPNSEWCLGDPQITVFYMDPGQMQNHRETIPSQIRAQTETSPVNWMSSSLLAK